MEHSSQTKKHTCGEKSWKSTTHFVNVSVGGSSGTSKPRILGLFEPCFQVADLPRWSLSQQLTDSLFVQGISISCNAALGEPNCFRRKALPAGILRGIEYKTAGRPSADEQACATGIQLHNEAVCESIRVTG